MCGSVAEEGGPQMYRLLEKLIGPLFKWRKKTCILVVKHRG